ncbi:MAG: hypothetical protein ACI4RA_07715 [Kiritimatiellia bacterium]
MRKMYILLAPVLALLAGCASFEPTRTQKFVDESGRFVLVDYGTEKEPRSSVFVLSNGVKLPFKSKLKVRVTMPDGDDFIAYQRMSTAGNLYLDEKENWEYFEQGTGCLVARRAPDGRGFLVNYQGTLCASVRNPLVERKQAIRSDSSTPQGFGHDSSGPRTVEQK